MEATNWIMSVAHGCYIFLSGHTFQSVLCGYKGVNRQKPEWLYFIYLYIMGIPYWPHLTLLFWTLELVVTLWERGCYNGHTNFYYLPWTCFLSFVVCKGISISGCSRVVKYWTRSSVGLYSNQKYEKIQSAYCCYIWTYRSHTDGFFLDAVFILLCIQLNFILHVAKCVVTPNTHTFSASRTKMIFFVGENYTITNGHTV